MAAVQTFSEILQQFVRNSCEDGNIQKIENYFERFNFTLERPPDDIGKDILNKDFVLYDAL